MELFDFHKKHKILCYSLFCYTNTLLVSSLKLKPNLFFRNSLVNFFLCKTFLKRLLHMNWVYMNTGFNCFWLKFVFGKQNIFEFRKRYFYWIFWQNLFLNKHYQYCTLTLFNCFFFCPGTTGRCTVTPKWFQSTGGTWESKPETSTRESTLSSRREKRTCSEPFCSSQVRAKQLCLMVKRLN